MSSNRHQKKEKDRPKQRVEKEYVVSEKQIRTNTVEERDKQKKKGLLLDVCACITPRNVFNWSSYF